MKNVNPCTAPAQSPHTAQTRRAASVRPAGAPVVPPACGHPLRGCASAIPDLTLTPRGPRGRGRDPQRAPVVAQVFAWRTVDRLGVTTITNRLNADPEHCPSPKPGGWNPTTVYAILRNPK